ncbi:MAG: F0F1 ATP synthase subunit epsilon [Pseudomonadota bacterium]|uniref:F0F1 ATP synthase subunit epsilon n=1 Tax=Thermithiobacillus tepidarius TaxID=929 RepID=UPI00041908B5|nr:F0F1 ATP synthase subunit epsilon [Thermithiobacillus tepidarius]
MAMTIRVEVVSAERSIFEGTAEMVVVPAEMGEIGVLPRHAPLLSRLRPGEVRVKNGEDTEYLFVNGGIVEVQPHLVTILSDTAERATDLDEAKALEAKRLAEERMAGNTSDIDYARAQADLLEQIARLRTITKMRERGLLK